MTNHYNNDYMSDDELLSEEQMMFPYLLALDNDIELLEEQSERQSLKPVTTPALPAVKGTTVITRTISAPNLITTDNNTATSATSSFAIDTLATDNIESTPCVDEPLNTLRNQLANAQKEIADLRHCVEQNQIRLLDQGIRMITMERQLRLLQPNVQSTNSLVGNSTPQTTQSDTPTEKDTEIQVTNLKRNPGESPNTDVTQPQTKRAKTLQTCAAESEKRTYKGRKPFCSLCNRHHDGPCTTPCNRCKAYGHQVQDCPHPSKDINSKAVRVCFKCKNTGHIKVNCPLLTIKGNCSLHDNLISLRYR